MGKSNKDGHDREPRPVRHPHVRPLPGVPPMYMQSQSPHVATYSLNGTNYYPHPYASHSKSSDDRYGNSDSSRQGSRSKHSSKSERFREEYYNPSRLRTSSSKANASVNAELKVSLAARHLAEQISESKKYWTTFYQKYEEEVASIKYYLNDDILERIWQKRIEYNSKYKNEGSKDDEEFNIQRMKLETCLDQVKEAVKAFARSRPPNDRLDHDPRHLALDKIRNTGALVLELAARSGVSSVPCVQLVTEASNLENLVDPKSPDAQVLYRFDKRKNKGDMPADGKNGNEGTQDQCRIPDIPTSHFMSNLTSNDPAPQVMELVNHQIGMDSSTVDKDGMSWN